jgi:hypothetical protein
METNHIIMTMGIHSTVPPWVSIRLIQTYKTKYRYWWHVPSITEFFYNVAIEVRMLHV